MGELGWKPRWAQVVEAASEETKEVTCSETAAIAVGAAATIYELAKYIPVIGTGMRLGENIGDAVDNGEWTKDNSRRLGRNAGEIGAILLGRQLGKRATRNPSKSAPKTVADGKITGHTRHGLNQAIGREGAGVKPGAILDAVKNPKQVIQQTGGRIKNVGQNATVVTNAEGKVITTWPHGSEGLRVPAGGN